MSMGLLRRILFAYSIGLAVVSAWVWLAHALGHAYGGVPTSLLWGPSLSASLLAVPHTDPNWRRQTHRYVVLVVSLLLLGSSLVGLVLLAGFHWKDGAGWAMADVVLASVLAAGVSIVGRSYGGRASRNTGDDQGF